MTSPPSQDSRNDPLPMRLRNEALAASPCFSPELHARLLTALRGKNVNALPSDAPLPRHSSWWLFRRIAIPLATAAAAAIVAWVILQPWNQPPAHDQIVTHEGAPGELPSLDIAHYVAPVRNALAVPAAKAFEQGKYGYLDQDARRLAIFVADQIPTFPINSPR